MKRHRPLTDEVIVTVPAEIGVGAALACIRIIAWSPAKYGRYSPGDVPRTLEEMETAHIDRTLRANNLNRTHAARELGISRATLIKKIKEYGLLARSGT